MMAPVEGLILLLSMVRFEEGGQNALIEKVRCDVMRSVLIRARDVVCALYGPVFTNKSAIQP